jgi:hypothetical protein
MKSLYLLLLAAVVSAGGCVARVETDPAPASVNVDVDPPRSGPDVKVNVD